jgi:hypothetical protein
VTICDVVSVLLAAVLAVDWIGATVQASQAALLLGRHNLQFIGLLNENYHLLFYSYRDN